MLESGSTELADCCCSAEMQLTGDIPTLGGGSEVRTFRCPVARNSNWQRLETRAKNPANALPCTIVTVCRTSNYPRILGVSMKKFVPAGCGLRRLCSLRPLMLPISGHPFTNCQHPSPSRYGLSSMTTTTSARPTCRRSGARGQHQADHPNGEVRHQLPLWALMTGAN